ncbi:hypothetical protein HWQ67_18365, partial [Candidatus Magnetobacterium casensis]
MEGGYGLKKIKEIGQSVLNKEGRELVGLPDPPDFKPVPTTQPKNPEGMPAILPPSHIDVPEPTLPVTPSDTPKLFTDQGKPPEIKVDSVSTISTPVTTLPKGAGSHNSPTYGKVSYTGEGFGLPTKHFGHPMFSGGGGGGNEIPTPTTTPQPN